MAGTELVKAGPYWNKRKQHNFLLPFSFTSFIQFLKGWSHCLTAFPGFLPFWSRFPSLPQNPVIHFPLEANNLILSVTVAWRFTNSLINSHDVLFRKKYINGKYYFNFTYVKLELQKRRHRKLRSQDRNEWNSRIGCILNHLGFH